MSLRDEVFKRMESVFQHRGGGDFTKISSADLKTLFEVYDDVYFDGDVSSQLSVSEMTIVFDVCAKKTGKVSKLTLPSAITNSTYTLRISPNVFVAQRLTRFRGIKCTTRLQCLMLVFEAELVTLIMDLWGYNGEKYKKYGNKLGECMAKRLFGHTVPTVSDEPPKKKMRVTSHLTEATSFGVYEYHSNSCYLDSLMMVLFANDGLRRALLHKTINIPYDEVVCGKKKLSRTQATSLAHRVRDVLKDDYRTLSSGRNTQCTVLRSVLGSCEPAISRGDMHNSAEVYAILSEFFGLKMKLPYSTSTELQSRSTVSVYDFLSGDSAIEWDRVNDKIIVFQNDMNPPIRELNTIGLETGSVRGDYFSVFKDRAFGETILDGKYTLAGVITLEGVVYGQSSGTHYTAYYRDFLSLGWLRYNDISGKAVPIKNLPDSGVWKFGSGKMPYMYFYSLTEKR